MSCAATGYFACMTAKGQSAGLTLSCALPVCPDIRTYSVSAGLRRDINCYSITSSARTSNEAGTVRPSALAVFMLMMSSNLVGLSIGKSEGLVPLKILST
ncbi:hypothetical protein ABIB95_009604 [Bradyrhizobium sp. LA2.1]|jgi:hypothetical protein